MRKGLMVMLMTGGAAAGSRYGTEAAWERTTGRQND
jgi:hypothetical protein